MKKRIADIVTRFRAEGLGPVRAALQQVAASAKKTRAQTAGVGRGMDRGVESSKRRVLRSFGEISRGGARAFREVNRAATRAYTGMVRGAASTAGAITGALGKISLNRYTLLGGAGILGGIGAGQALKAISPLFTGGLALGGAIGAGILSVLDANKILGLTETLGVGPEVAGQWQLMANRVGLSTDDIGGSLQGLKSTMIESLDPTSDAAKLFKKLGVSVKDGSGQLRSVSKVMFDLSDATSKLTDQQRSFALAEIFGEADAAKISELLRTLGTDREKLLKEFEKNKADGLFASAEDLKRIKEFRVSFLALIAPLKAFARELFLTFEPFFSKVLKNLEVLFRNPEERARIIQDWFVKPFQRGLQLLNDLLRVFAGFDLMAWIGGVDGPTPIMNAWTISLKNFLVEAWRVITGIGALFIGLGAAILDIATLIDNLVERATGVRIGDW